MDPTFADYAVHVVLIGVVVWTIAGNPNLEKAQSDGGTQRYPWISRARIALPVAAGALIWRYWARGPEGGLTPLLIALALLAYWVFAREIQVDKKGVWNTRLQGRMRSGMKWKEIDRARVTTRRSGGRDRTTIELMDKEDRVSLVHGGALIDAPGFVEELERRGVEIERPQQG